METDAVQQCSSADMQNVSTHPIISRQTVRSAHAFLVHTHFTTTRHSDPIKIGCDLCENQKEANPPLWTCIGFAAPTTGAYQKTDQSVSRVVIRLWGVVLSFSDKTRAMNGEHEQQQQQQQQHLHQAIRGTRKGKLGSRPLVFPSRWWFQLSRYTSNYIYLRKLLPSGECQFAGVGVHCPPFSSERWYRGPQK